MSNTKNFADLMKVCSVLPALLVMPAFAATYSDDITIADGKTLTVRTGTEETYTGALTGEGTFAVTPGGKVDGVYKDTVAVLEGSVAGFTGDFSTIQYGNKGLPNSVSSIVNWDAAQGFNLVGNGYFVFDGNETVKIASAKPGNSAGTVFLNGNALSTESVVDKKLNIHMSDADKDIELNGYKSLSKAEIFVIDGGQTINGNL